MARQENKEIAISHWRRIATAKQNPAGIPLSSMRRQTHSRFRIL